MCLLEAEMLPMTNFTMRDSISIIFSKGLSFVNIPESQWKASQKILSRSSFNPSNPRFQSIEEIATQ
jgi:hypothetical protein